MPSFTYETNGDVSLSSIFTSILGWIRRNVLWLLLGAVAGSVISYFLNEAKPKEYTSSMVGYSNNFDDLRIREILQHLQTLRALNEKAELAKRLGITEEEAGEITSIACFPNNTLQADLPPFPPREAKVYFFSIAATVRNPELFPKLEKSIVNYVDRQEIVQKRLMELRTSTQRRINQEIAEVAYLQELKKELLTSKANIQIMDIGTISRHIVDIYEKMEDNRLYLEKLDHEIVVTRSMEIIRKPSSPGMYRAAGFGAAMGFLAVLAFMALLAIIRFSKNTAG